MDPLGHGYQSKIVDLLIEALYGPEHLNISTSSGNEVDNDTSTGMAWCDSRRDTMRILFDSFRQIIVDDERDVGYLRVFDLYVIHYKDLRRRLPH